MNAKPLELKRLPIKLRVCQLSFSKAIEGSELRDKIKAKGGSQASLFELLVCSGVCDEAGELIPIDFARQLCDVLSVDEITTVINAVNGAMNEAVEKKTPATTPEVEQISNSASV